MNSLWWWDLNLNRQRTFASSQAPTLLAVTAAQKNVSKKVFMMNDFLTRLEFSLSCVRARATFLVCCDDDGVRKFLHGKNIQNPARSVRKKNKDERWFFSTDQQENENFFIAALQIDCFSFWVSRRRSWAVARVAAHYRLRLSENEGISATIRRELLWYALTGWRSKKQQANEKENKWQYEIASIMRGCCETWAMLTMRLTRLVISHRTTRLLQMQPKPKPLCDVTRDELEFLRSTESQPFRSDDLLNLLTTSDSTRLDLGTREELEEFFRWPWA